MNAKLLKDKAEMLREYFCIHIDEQKLSKLPVILDQYTPDMDHVPEFMLSLANDVSLYISSWFSDQVIFMWILLMLSCICRLIGMTKKSAFKKFQLLLGTSMPCILLSCPIHQVMGCSSTERADQSSGLLKLKEMK